MHRFDPVQRVAVDPNPRAERYVSVGRWSSNIACTRTSAAIAKTKKPASPFAVTVRIQRFAGENRISKRGVWASIHDLGPIGLMLPS